MSSKHTKPSKSCEVCGTIFLKPSYCSMADWPRRRFCSLACKSESQRGKPTWSKGKRFPRPTTFLPCRICGEPTRYSGTERAKLYGKVHCGQPECAEASRAIKNDRLSESMKGAVREGRQQLNGWADRGWESADEAALRPWFETMGWEAQYVCRTGISERPRWFRLDFALVSMKLYVEIDGSVHRRPERRARDERRSTILTSLGWKGLHIPASDVQDDIDAVKRTVLCWIDEHKGHSRYSM